jgi:hypothetical protein
MITKKVYVPSDEVICVDEYAESWKAMYELSMADVANIKKYISKEDSEIFSYRLYFMGSVSLYQGDDENPEETLRIGGEYIIVYPKTKYSNGSAYIEVNCKYTGTTYEFEIKLD